MIRPFTVNTLKSQAESQVNSSSPYTDPSRNTASSERFYQYKITLSGTLLTQFKGLDIGYIHPVGRARTSEWSVCSVIMDVYEKFFFKVHLEFSVQSMAKILFS